MNIILGKENADKIAEKSILLELDTFIVTEKEHTAYCVISIEDIPLPELPGIDNTIKLHESFVDGMKSGNLEYSKTLSTILKDKFGGILKEYYTSSIERLEKNTTESWEYVIVK